MSDFNKNFLNYDMFHKHYDLILCDRRIAESFSGWVRFSKLGAGLLKYYMLNLISVLFKVPSCEYMCK